MSKQKRYLVIQKLRFIKKQKQKQTKTKTTKNTRLRIFPWDRGGMKLYDTQQMAIINKTRLPWPALLFTLS